MVTPLHIKCAVMFKAFGRPEGEEAVQLQRNLDGQVASQVRFTNWFFYVISQAQTCTPTEKPLRCPLKLHCECSGFMGCTV